ncbi:glutamate-1-semialdehyde-2,1-aminomutase [Candidatus Pantoea edessiphila]|uniref:Glutamate-1-semialdehyde 2,1-aminomutase n=1 Tax=Candidatus Pantoea edessiphila TaxID=2044610 RepID=A0A2P5T259_9GAMM|nr:glutamate-1-semialdehyde 2,1-aminomutase [Candidatus Pantoea edessiphila]PPI88667.1 glutamate-1-semialdehyde-2,1-aminomutase [Candidatus Pantoea edessiphila]
MNNSNKLFLIAKNFMPGGVNSPVRSFNKVGGSPFFIQRAQGAYLYDIDNRHYIDYVGAWGSMILGHNNTVISESVIKTIKNGLNFGIPTKIELLMAQLICKLVQSIEMVRMVNSGTEATMSAVRLARGFTKRKKIIKFRGCYHGHVDQLLANNEDQNPTGIPYDFIKHTLICEYNDLHSVRKQFIRYPKDIAAIIVEPIAGNMSCVLPKFNFLQGLRNLCDEFNSLLIMDEVMTGFRVALGGAQELYNIKADITCLGKIIGAGMPIGAFGGSKKIMSNLSPTGEVYQAGTCSGNPVVMAAGYNCLKQITEIYSYKTLKDLTDNLTVGLRTVAKKNNIPLVINSICGMFGFFFTEKDNVIYYSDVIKCNTDIFKKFFHLMMKQGVYFAPSPFETNFVSLAHNVKDINKTIDAANVCFSEL